MEEENVTISFRACKTSGIYKQSQATEVLIQIFSSNKTREFCLHKASGKLQIHVTPVKSKFKIMLKYFFQTEKSCPFSVCAKESNS